LVGSVCAAAGLSLDNKRLAAELRARLAELQASRARLVQMADTERRRIERDLHDGAQQQLVILKSSLGLARWLVTSLPEAAGVLAQTEQQVAEALEQLRELAGRIYPPLLAELGAERRAGGLRKGDDPGHHGGSRDRQVPGSRPRPQCTSASWERCRTPRNTHRHPRSTSLSAMTALSWCSPSLMDGSGFDPPSPRRKPACRA
jgi:Histidine kinase